MTYLTLGQIQLEFLRCKLKDEKDYYAELPKHPDWPNNPEIYYAEKWPGWKIFLLSSHKYRLLDLSELVIEAKKQDVKNMTDYLALCKDEARWPFNPEKVYVDWPGEKKFLKMVRGAKIPPTKPPLEEDIFLLSNFWGKESATA